MRLSSQELRAIKEVVAALDPTAKVYLFGSRVDDKKTGGDLDLLILSEVISEHDRRDIRVKLFEQIGEQKLDLLIASDTSKPFVRIVLSQGVLL